MWLKFYEKENIIFEKESNIMIPEKNLQKIAKKLAHHYGFRCPKVYVKNLSSSAGLGRRFSITISRKYCNLLTLCHELGHTWQLSTGLHCRHDKKLMRQITKFIKYCLKNQSIRGMMNLCD